MSGYVEPSQDYVDHKRQARMRRIDDLSPPLRELVNEYGFHVVNSYLSVGISKPGQIRHLVEVVLDEFSPTRGSFSQQGIRKIIGDAALKGEAE